MGDTQQLNLQRKERSLYRSLRPSTHPSGVIVHLHEVKYHHCHDEPGQSVLVTEFHFLYALGTPSFSIRGGKYHP